MTKLLLTVGNGLMGDDGAGPLLAQLLAHTHLNGWVVLNGGSSPENVLHQIREHAPSHVVVIDSADMDLPPGSIRKVPQQNLENPLYFTTHTLPLTFLIESLNEFVLQSTFIGIQPEIVAFGFPMSSSVSQAVKTLLNNIVENTEDWYQNIEVLDL
jgi:hydrogenase 3 maturation protease